MTYNFKSKARIEKGDDGSLSFYDDRGAKVGSVIEGNSESLARTYHNLQDAYNAGYLTRGKYEQFERIFRNRLGYEPLASERPTLEARDRTHDGLVAKCMPPASVPSPSNVPPVEVKLKRVV